MRQEVVGIKLSCIKPYGFDFAKKIYNQSDKEPEIKDDQPQNDNEHF